EQDFIEEYVLTTDIASRYWIGGYSETYPYDFKWVTGEEFNYINWAAGEPNLTNELYIEIYGNNTGMYGCWNNITNVYFTKSFICEWEDESILGNGIRVYNALKLIALPEDFGAVSINSTQDYDGDGLLDVEEIMFGHVLYGEPDKNGECELPTFGDVLVYVADQSNIELPEEWGLGDDALKKLFDTKVVLVLSDPTSIDTDGEGIPDNIDIRPLKYDDYADKYIEFINAGYIDMNKMIQTSDGFTICMTPLSEILDHLNYPNLAIHFLSDYIQANEEEGIEEIPATIGYDKYADFWYLYSVQTEDTVVYSMIKLRENSSIFSSGVAVPFIEFDIELLKDYDKIVDLDVLDSEFRKVMGGNGAVHNDVLVEYFGYMPSEALLLIPQLYIDIILEKECIDRGTNILWITEKVCPYSRSKLYEYKYDISQEAI
ncbi:MAG: C-type lectin domain-containing protein, partial [Lachnospiraceae bacterium]|nr:C-type lectin domain-containing protein [Lachnospiraceae bacterium]